MKLNENVGSIITEEQAKELIGAFKVKFDGEVTSSFIGASNIRKILEQKNCIGLRIYNGYDDETQKLNLVIVGVDNEEKELLEEGMIIDKLLICPDYCPMDGLGF